MSYGGNRSRRRFSFLSVSTLVLAAAVGTSVLFAQPKPAPAKAEAAKPAPAKAAPAKPAASKSAETPVERGKYLVTTTICNDCHTPLKMGANGPEPDMARMLSGHPQDLKMSDPPKPQGAWMGSFSTTLTAFSGPWGVSYAVNLTPDPETGIGHWTEDRFIRALRTGKHLGGGRDILPPMPWPWIAQMTDADLKAIFAYLKTIPPIKNQVPDAVIAPPPPTPPAGKP